MCGVRRAGQANHLTRPAGQRIRCACGLGATFLLLFFVKSNLHHEVWLLIVPGNSLIGSIHCQHGTALEVNAVILEENICQTKGKLFWLSLFIHLFIFGDIFSVYLPFKQPGVVFPLDSIDQGSNKCFGRAQIELFHFK